MDAKEYLKGKKDLSKLEEAKLKLADKKAQAVYVNKK